MFRIGMLVWCDVPGDDPWLLDRGPRAPFIVHNIEEVGAPDDRHTHLWVEHGGQTRGGFDASRFVASGVPLVIGDEYRVYGPRRVRLAGFKVQADDSVLGVTDTGEELPLQAFRALTETTIDGDTVSDV